jgi:putative ABC transport system permease protein
MGLLAGGGFLALLMAAGGVYGITSYMTSRQRQEIGLRMALGATRRNVEALVFGQSFSVSLIGLMSGLMLAAILMKILRSVLAGLYPGHWNDLWIEIGKVVLSAALACWLPARRAARIDPGTALRQE